MAVTAAATALAVLSLTAALPASGSRPTDTIHERGPIVSRALHHDASPPLRDLAPAHMRRAGHRLQPLRRLPVHATRLDEAAIPSRSTARAMPATLVSFDGMGAGFSGPSGSFTVASAPPDPAGAVGPNHYVETVNTDLAIFNKTGTPLYGPVPLNTLWSGFGGGCQTNNDGDATVEYDRLSDRWVISQFSVSTAPTLYCVAVSKTADPTGAYWRYAFSYGNDFPDYPKLGVWPDAYYATFNMFNGSGTAFLGGKACAYDRAKMLQGQAATQQCFNTTTAWGALLPADLDGSTPPPAGAPNYLLALGDANLGFWKFHVDWATPGDTDFRGPTLIPVTAYTGACPAADCIPQGGTTRKLEGLGDRLMYRLAYRNFGDHESLVVNHSINTVAAVGVRWYELRDPNGTPLLYQEGTYAPDTSFRWMGSIAMDRSGDVALGFSRSSSNLYPQIHYTGRLASDPVGMMTQGEGTIVDGAGSQSGNSGLTRWGDYTSMTVDPSDDCTFWYVNQYQATTGEFNWHTRIGSFKFPSCGASDFSISADPSSLTVAEGRRAASTVHTAVTTGSAQAIALTASGLPPYSSVKFDPASVTAGDSSTMTIHASAGTPVGHYTVTVTGTSTAATHAATVDVTVTCNGSGMVRFPCRHAA